MADGPEQFRNRSFRSKGHIWKGFLIPVMIPLVVTGLSLVPASPVAAKTKSPKFSGAAPGSVTCSVSASVSFSPPLSTTGGGTSKSVIKAKLTGCRASNPAVTITSAKAQGSFATSPYNCVTKSPTGSKPTLSVTWKGDVNGVVGGITYAGKAKFTTTVLSGSSATGSFATSAASLALPIPGSATAACATTKGIKKLALSGSVAVGSSSPSAALVSSVAYDGFDGYCAVMTSSFAADPSGVECWGDGGAGELGNGTTFTSSDVPVMVQSLGGGNLSGVSSVVDDGTENYCALLDSGDVACWGSSQSDGELGDGTNNSSSVAVTVLTNVASLYSDTEGFCAVLLGTGGVDCWGFNGDGELGDGTSSGPEICTSSTDPCSTTPVAVEGVGGVGVLSGVSSLTSDAHGYCALVSRDLDCWGENIATTPVDEGLSDVTSVVGKGGTYCAVVGPSASVDCFGDNSVGQLGDGTTTSSGTPVPVCDESQLSCTPTSNELAGVASLAVDADASFCAMLLSGGVDCWGPNSAGELGDGTSDGPDTCSGQACATTPVEVQAVGGGGALANVASISNDGRFSFCAVTASGGVDCWGDGGQGQLGNDSFSGSDVPVPVQAVGGGGSLSGVGSVVSTGLNSEPSYCALLASGTQIDCWGDDFNGELGNAEITTQPVSVPVMVSGIGP